MEPTPLILGLPISGIPVGPPEGILSEGSAPVDAICGSSKSTALISWTFSSPERNGLAVVMGCEDGSCYLFWPSKDTTLETTSSPTIQSPATITSPRPTRSPVSPLPSRIIKSPSPTPSRASTHSTSLLHIHSHPPSIIAPRSTAVTAGVSKAQVEAPKAFVDYEDEPEHLRSMLKTNRTDGASRRSPSDTPASGSGATSPTGVSEPQPDAGHLTSPDVSLSSPLPLWRDKAVNDISALELRLRILPPRIGFGHSVAALKLLEGGTLLACLQKSGGLSLFSISDGRCLVAARVDEFPRLKPPMGCKAVPEIHGYFKWQNMRVAQDGQSTLLFISGQDSLTPTSTASEPLHMPDLRITVIRVRSPYERALTPTAEEFLEKVGDWLTDGPSSSMGLHIDSQGDLSIYRLSSSSHFILQTVQFLPNPPSPPPASKGLSSGNPSNTLFPLAQSFNQLKLANPFKSSHSRQKSSKFIRYAGNNPASFEPGSSRIEVGDEIDLGELRAGETDPLDVMGLSLCNFNPKVMGCLWSLDRCLIFRLGTKRESPRVLITLDVDDVLNVLWLDTRSFTIITQDHIQTYRLHTTDENNDELKDDSWFNDPTKRVLHSAERIYISEQANISTSVLISPSVLLVSSTLISENSSSLVFVPVPVMVGHRGSKKTSSRKGTLAPPKTIWERTSLRTDKTYITSISPFSIDLVVVGLSDGTIAKATMEDLLVERNIPAAESVKATEGLEAPILSIDCFRNSRNGERFVLGSSVDGALGVWDLIHLKLKARWTIFATPLWTVLDLTDEDSAGMMKDCLLCVAEQGTIAVILIDGLELLHLIPASTCPLERICIGGDNLLLSYADSKARLWDVKTHEFWRAMTRDKAADLLEQGGWFEAFIDHDGALFPGENSCFGFVRNTEGGSDYVLVDIRELLRSGVTSLNRSDDRSGPPTPTRVGTLPDHSRMVTAWKCLHPILSGILTISIDPDFDELCLGLLGAAPTPRSPSWSVTSFKGSMTSPACSTDLDVFRLSPEYTSAFLLASTALLRSASMFEEWDSLSSQLSTYLMSSLAESVGSEYRQPSLEFLTHYWFDSSAEIKHAARAVFASTVKAYNEKEVTRVVEEWRHRLPSVQPESLKDVPYAAVSLLLVGNIAAEHYAIISTDILTDIAKSVVLYLHDESSPHRVLAIELCSVGFHVWQHYVDAVNVLRALFELATSSKKDTVSTITGNVGPQARTAVLQIASTNPPLFMTTLTMDIAQPESLEHRRSVMQLIAFIIRKKPLVLYPNLTRLVEAVIKSLDPSSGNSREAVMDPAVEILGHVVRTFPTVDFHKGTQRLALGTNEGAVIMYDLKTATRLYVLEGHKKRTSAVSFSPDGRRLVTASLDESLVMVWKVGSSFSSFFNPGAPPRQGASGSEAYKSLPFNVGDEARMTVASTLDWVAFEWPNDRTARLKIRDSVLTFNTT